MEKHRIFIVEDDVKIASLLAETLRKYQYEVETIKEFDHLIEEFPAHYNSPALNIKRYPAPRTVSIDDVI